MSQPNHLRSINDVLTALQTLHGDVTRMHDEMHDEMRQMEERLTGRIDHLEKHAVDLKERVAKMDRRLPWSFG